jgi:hypothetical protein
MDTGNKVKRIILIAFLSSQGWAACPLYTYPENHKIDQEMNNICDNIQSVSNGISSTSSITLRGLTVSSLTVTSQAQIKGTKTNDSAAVGYVGEFIRGYATGVTAAASGTFGDVVSISLTAGDWDVSCNLEMIPQAGTTISLSPNGTDDVAISAYSGNTTTDHVPGDNLYQFNPYGTASTTIQAVSGSIPSFRVSLSGTATYYLKGKIYYSSTAPIWYGRISARRMR